MKVTEIFALTGEVVERDATKAEAEQRKKDEAQYLITEAERKTEVNAKATAKAALLDRLGITAEEAVLLLS
jgi:hypothetical protein